MIAGRPSVTVPRPGAMAFWLAVLALAAFVGLPLVWLIISSLSSATELLARPPHWIPAEPTLVNYLTLFGFASSEESAAYVTAVRYFFFGVLNSILVSSGATIVVVLAATVPAYLLARMVSPAARNLILLSLIAIRMIPQMTLMLPLYVIAQRAGVLDSVALVTIVYAAFSLPYVVWILTGFFQRLPSETEEAALIDGCSRLGVIGRVVLPLSVSGLFAAAVFVFVLTWSDMFTTLVLTSRPEAQTLPVLLATFVTTVQEVPWGILNASSVLAVLPPAFLAIFFRRYVVTGLMAGAGK